MSQCFICQKEACSNPEHASPVFLKFAPALWRRLEVATFRRLDWRGYHIAPREYGKLPVLFHLSLLDNSPSPALADRVWWLRSAETVKGKLHQLTISLVEVPSIPPAGVLSLFEGTLPLSPLPGKATVSLRGRSERGYFLLTTSPSSEAVVHTTVLDEVVKLELATGLPWRVSRVAGTMKTLSSGKITIYDHRESDDHNARVVVGTATSNAGRSWQYVHFYPVFDELPLGRFVVNPSPKTPVIDYDREGVQWVGQTPDHWMFFILTETETDLASCQEALDMIEAAVMNPAAPQPLLDALEGYLLSALASGYAGVAARTEFTESQLNESWEKYKKIRARAERTTFINESATSFKLAIFLIARMCGYEKGVFDEYVERMFETLTETTETGGNDE